MNPVTSPTLPTNEGIVTTAKEFSDALTLDLTDDEIARALRVTIPIKEKWQLKFRSALRHNNFTISEAMKMVDDFESELKTELAEKCDLLVSVDVSDVFDHGGPPVITFEGALPSHSSAKYGFDHDRKEWEVKKAKDKDQAFLGVDKIDS